LSRLLPFAAVKHIEELHFPLSHPDKANDIIPPGMCCNYDQTW